ncbi:hypothetical protein [Sulfurovum riftiae]|uniref:Uncharacterized protein n=1 Tax=Sulfurovum riftiae TaxID=1630136 RepID=A0A151CEA1_9BACT|nr:hypothetical protein [Sulfurovum riftiae]KYJ85860.1 hypothetical protein AS592_04520 [Sulfurovum riftiae]
MKLYIYNSEIGRFEIRQSDHRKYDLWINEEMLGPYESAERAAEDVANFETDYVAWDKFKNELENVPSDLSKWTEIKEESPE